MAEQRIIGFEEFESGRVVLPEDEVFEAEWGAIVGYTYENGQVVEHRRVVGYRGRKTGMRLGRWFAEVAEVKSGARGGI